MSWSAKIQIGTGGVQGYNEWQVFYDATTQPTYKTLYGTEISQPEPDILWHRPDEGPQVPARATAQNKQIVLTMDVIAADWDTVISSLIPLKLALSGSDSQALRASIDGTSDTVRVAITPDGSSYTTYYNVLYGTVDDSEAYYKPEAIANTLARQVTFYLTVEPGGYGNTITLRNDLASSPGFIEFNTSATLADGWSLTASAPTPSVNTTNFLTGGSSQQLVTDNTNGQGIVSDTVACATDDPVVAYVWLKNPGQDDTSVQLLDGSNNQITSVSLSTNDAGGVSDKMVKDSAGGTWYRVPTSDDGAPARAAANIKLRVIRTSANATEITNITIDNAYLYVGSTTAPQAWCSTSSLKNRYDPTIAEANINYFDTWGIPGDLPALSDLFLDVVSGGSGTAIQVNRYHDNSELASNIPYWIDSDGFSNSIGAFTAQTGTTNNHYWRLPSGTATGYLSASVEWKYFDLGPCLIHAFFRASATSVTVYARLRSDSSTTPGGTEFIVGESKSVNTANTWEVVDLGLFNLSEIFEKSTAQSITIELVVENATSQTADIDACLMFPVSSTYEYIQSDVNKYSGALATAYDYKINGTEERLLATDKFYKQAAYGSLWNIFPGNIMTRDVFIFKKTTQDVDITTAYSATLTITPRTSHLLGAL